MSIVFTPEDDLAIDNRVPTLIQQNNYTIKFVNGSIFDLNVELITNPVNTVGVLGKGLAKIFAAKYPKECLVYRQACFHGTLKAGTILVVGAADGKKLAMIPTKIHWRDKSNLWLVHRGVKELTTYCSQTGIRTIGLCALGCGCGNLNWPSVWRTMVSGLQHSDDLIWTIVFPKE